jgi:hypothetical protein
VGDAEQCREDEQDEDPEDHDHSDECLCLFTGHVTNVAPDTPYEQWQDCRTPSNNCHTRGTLAAC